MRALSCLASSSCGVPNRTGLTSVSGPATWVAAFACTSSCDGVKAQPCKRAATEAKTKIISLFMSSSRGSRSFRVVDNLVGQPTRRQGEHRLDVRIDVCGVLDQVVV